MKMVCFFDTRRKSLPGTSLLSHRYHQQQQERHRKFQSFSHENVKT